LLFTVCYNDIWESLSQMPRFVYADIGQLWTRTVLPAPPLSS